MAVKIKANQIKKIREETGAGVMEIKGALEEAKGSETKAKEILAKKGLEKVAKRADKDTKEGQIYAYVHSGGRVAAMVKILCETDFVSRSEEFQKLTKELTMQVASMDPKDIKDLLKQPYIRDAKKTVADLVNEMAAKCKERITVKEIARMSL
ncbi:MAG: translation elongation factor Ts [Candidatus Beckwithbacteria bacterium]|nr:translation elongation factor Ts [Candidatus Beckwithbacteria bacterium]